MRKTLSGRPRRSQGRGRGRGLVAALAVPAVLVTLLTACGDGGGGSAPSADGGTTPPSQAAGPAPDALAVTATAGQERLPDGKPGLGKPPVVIGSKDFPEETLLGELYTQALAAKGYTVILKANVGGSELIDTSLASDQIQMYPEYLGEIVTSVAHQPAPISASDTYNKAKGFEEQQRGATVLKQTPFQDTDAVAVSGQTAQQYGLTTISDLNSIAPAGAGLTIAGQNEFSTRQTGLLGVQQQYNLRQLGFLSAQAGQQYQALDQGRVQIADAFTTDAALQSGKYKLLQDPQNVFGYQYVAPVLKQSVLTQDGPDFVATCNWVSSLLTTQAIQALNGEVQTDGGNTTDIAQQFLAVNGLD